MSIDNSDAFIPTHTNLPYTGRSHMHGDSRVVMTYSRSLVYTKVHSPPPVASTKYQQAHTQNIQNPIPTQLGGCYMHMPKPQEKYQSPGKMSNMMQTLNNSSKLWLSCRRGI